MQKAKSFHFEMRHGCVMNIMDICHICLLHISDIYYEPLAYGATVCKTLLKRGLFPGHFWVFTRTRHRETVEISRNSKTLQCVHSAVTVFKYS